MTTTEPTWEAGQVVEWLYEPRGGWGYRWWVPATVVNVGRSRVTISTTKRDGETKLVSVKPENLRAK